MKPNTWEPEHWIAGTIALLIGAFTLCFCVAYASHLIEVWMKLPRAESRIESSTRPGDVTGAKLVEDADLITDAERRMEHWVGVDRKGLTGPEPSGWVPLPDPPRRKR